MKLIREISQEVQYLKEDTGTGANAKKEYYISGVFIQAETPNRNNRIYPVDLVNREVARYKEDFVDKNRAMGELGHPESPTLNLERVSHLITDLKCEGTDVIGKAKILDTPYGKIMKNFIDEGIKMGVSTRGLGSLKENTKGLLVVQDDFQLNAIDIVGDPSAPRAFVENIMEGAEWYYENGILKAKDIESYRKQIRKAKKAQTEEIIMKLFTDFMQKL